MGNEINAKDFFDGILKEIKADKNIKNYNLVKETIENKNLNDYFKDCRDTKIIIPILQKVNEYFIKNCNLHITDSLILIPIETEIYFANKDCGGACHENDLQKGRFGKLYFHRRGKNKNLPIDIIRGGVDVCISDNDYYLSILIRSAYFIKDNKEDKKTVVGIRKILDKIILECYKDDKDIKDIENILEKRNKKEKLKEYKKKIEEINDRLKKEIEDKDNIKILKSSINSDKEIEKHCRIKDKDYFCSYNELKRAELNSFIKNNEIVKEIYKDKSKEIRKTLERKLENENLFKK